MSKWLKDSRSRQLRKLQGDLIVTTIENVEDCERHIKPFAGAGKTKKNMIVCKRCGHGYMSASKCPFCFGIKDGEKPYGTLKPVKEMK